MIAQDSSSVEYQGCGVYRVYASNFNEVALVVSDDKQGVVVQLAKQRSAATFAQGLAIMSCYSRGSLLCYRCDKHIVTLKNVLPQLCCLRCQ